MDAVSPGDGEPEDVYRVPDTWETYELVAPLIDARFSQWDDEAAPRSCGTARDMSVPTPVTRLAAVLRADNPGPMTLDGTRSYVLRAPGSASCVVVDPGPDDAAHLDALAAAGPVELALVTHRHADHTAGSPAARAHRRPGARRRPDHCHGGAPLRDGEVIEAAGLRVVVLATPGHTADSVCLVLPDDGPVPDRRPHLRHPGPGRPGPDPDPT